MTFLKILKVRLQYLSLEIIRIRNILCITINGSSLERYFDNENREERRAWGNRKQNQKEKDIERDKNEGQKRELNIGILTRHVHSSQ